MNVKMSPRWFFAVVFLVACCCCGLFPVARGPRAYVTAASTEAPAPTNAPAGTLFAETFSGPTTAPANTFYYALSTPNPASGTQYPPCLTAAPTIAPGATAPPSGTTLPGCPSTDPIGATPLPEPAGTGTLRLTDNTGNQAGFVLYNKAFPSGAGAQVVFKYWSYNGSGADGLAVFIIDGSQSPTIAGAYGGSLGYAQKTGVPGIVGGVIGLGLDEYGNYMNPTEGRVGGPGAFPNEIAIRGNAANNYLYIAGTGDPATGIPTLPMALNFSSATSRTAATPRLVRFTLSSLGEVTVDISFTGNAANFVNAIPPQILTGQTVPSSLKLGFTGSTGGSTDIHEVQGLYGDPAPADPEIAMTQNTTTFTGTGQSIVYTISPSNSGAGGYENKAVTVTDVLPAGLTYVSAAGSGWTCGYTTGTRTVSCSFTPTNAPAGSSYNPITLSTTLTATTGAITNTATVSSPDDMYYGNDNASTTGQYVPTTAPIINIYKRILQILTNGPTPGPTTTPRAVTFTPDPYPTNIAGVLGTASSQSIYPGDIIEYALYFKNVGKSAAQAPIGSATSGPVITDTIDSNYVFDESYTPAPTFSCCVFPTVTITAPYAYNPANRTLTWTLSTPLPTSSPSPAGATPVPVQGSITYSVKIP